MKIELQLKEVIRFMLLPMSDEKENDSIELIIKILIKHNIEENSHAEFIRLKYDIWRRDAILDDVLREIIGEILLECNGEFGILFSEKYFEIHYGLIKNPFLSFELGVIMLSHLQLITNLAVHEKMSSAKISKVIQSIDYRLSIISWKEIQFILRQLKILPQLLQERVEELYIEDEGLEEEYFADADKAEAILIIGEIAKNLQFSKDAAKLLSTLSHIDNVHLPYLQILHYQCLISGFYDHVLSAPYEFNPRGNIANWLFAKWDNLLHTSNPILNNAKAVDVLDENWARSRKQNEYEQASALVELLKGIDGMGFSAAKEFTSWLRRWLVRYIKLESITIVPLSSNMTAQEIINVLNFINSSPTETYGILEQRYLDAIVAGIYRKEDGWRFRGVSDSVNSNNLSKRKLGDCDFQNSNEKIIVAYEAHGGVLSKVYYEGHIRTFRRALHRRKEELESIADIELWQFELIFVAYGFEEGLLNQFKVDGLRINVEFMTFKDLYDQVNVNSETFKKTFNDFFIEILNNRRTPSMVREKVRLLN